MTSNHRRRATTTADAPVEALVAAAHSGGRPMSRGCALCGQPCDDTLPLCQEITITRYTDGTLSPATHRRLCHFCVERDQPGAPVDYQRACWRAVVAAADAIANQTGWALTGLRNVIARGDLPAALAVLGQLQAEAAKLSTNPAAR